MLVWSSDSVTALGIIQLGLTGVEHLADISNNICWVLAIPSPININFTLFLFEHVFKLEILSLDYVISC